jgi:hypothetical protein
MNQRADSWKKNLASIVAKPPNKRRGCFLSHTSRPLIPDGTGGYRRAKRQQTASRLLVIFRDRPQARPVMMSWPRRRLLRVEVDPATITEFGLAPHHARRDPRDIRNFRTAQAERIAHARLLLRHGVGPSGRGPRTRNDGRGHRKPFHSNRESIHVSPKPPPRANSERARLSWQASLRIKHQLSVESIDRATRCARVPPLELVARDRQRIEIRQFRANQRITSESTAARRLVKIFRLTHSFQPCRRSNKQVTLATSTQTQGT